ncbi:aspartyl/asparaginyl beta-hydroxylase domain-containing protein [Sandarakinorhabdus sp.]|uniref:aspartyl/asparaginyl beta-hydroxylase domain-containing protein n=1 Tax=Sandarakinorhabdus sp. TaxID=1916663 RepID=UPI00286E7FBB|nr:aspartyl/asparaginyl beta-hydroxylase domain-containing protein [Sandarakinorhabdus sp.]
MTSPADPAQLNSIGMAALGRGDAAAAITALTAATTADPAAAILWYNLSNAHGLAGDAVAQSEALDSALERDPFMEHALLAKGRLQESIGDVAGAIFHYQRLVAAVNPAAPMGPGFAAGLGHAKKMLEAESARLSDQIGAAMDAALAAAPQEDAARMTNAIEVALGRRRSYVQQPLVFDYPGLPPDQYFARRHFPWLEQLEAATPVIRAELQALLDSGGEGFAPYVAYPRGAPVNQWAALNHKDAWAAQFLIEHGENRPLRERCPQTAAVIDALPLFDVPGRGPVAFFSLLKAGAHIPPHTGATNIRSIVHLPLIVPPGCWFRVGNETRAWEEGRALVFDDTIEHEAMNPSGELRAILIIDAWNPHLSMAERDLLRQYMTALDAAGRGRTWRGAN